MDDLEATIKRLEAAEVGSRKLDAQICVVADRLRAIRWYWTGATGIPHAVPENFDLLKGGMGTASIEAMCPAYSTSIDAALTLVPEGWRGRFGFDEHGTYIKQSPFGLIGMAWGFITPPDKWDAESYSAKAPSIPLALCIAALKARSLHTSGDGE